jgi:hypothetical protein
VTFLAAVLFLPFAPFEVLLVAGGSIVGVWTGSLNLIGKLKAKSVKTKAKVTAAASKDPIWHETALQNRVAQTFTDYQRDWSTFNIEHIKTYVTPRYYQHVSLMLTALKVMDRKNDVANPELLAQYIAEANDNKDDTKDNFVAVINGRANDKLIDIATNKTLYTDTSSFVEYWRFLRSGDTWLLDSVGQATENINDLHAPLKIFAEAHGMFYSLDWGWLLLPQRGELFKKSSFLRSDVNNHVIGEWNGIIVQMYTYRPDREVNSNFQIAQITLPKSYGGIIIKRKSFWNFTPKGYLKLTYEWPDFNKRYDVFATDMDKVTSFELLNPKFMADLYDKNLKVEIEVVDNVVYLYSKMAVGETKYPDMLEILRQAFHELKM